MISSPQHEQRAVCLLDGAGETDAVISSGPLEAERALGTEVTPCFREQALPGPVLY